MSLESKMVYAVLRDRMELSRKNGWVTDDGEIYLLYSREHLAEFIGCSEQTIRRSMKQLIDNKLIDEKRQGQGKPNIIFVCHVEQTLENTKTDIFGSSRPYKNNSLDLPNLPPSDTDTSETDQVTLNNENDKGSNSGEIATYCINPLEFRTEINVARKYFAECYEKAYREKYHKHKADQNKIIDEKLNWAFGEYSLDVENMEDMIRAYFNRVKCDHNLMHFVTDGILENRMYEVAY
jgi:hypothetical protein